VSLPTSPPLPDDDGSMRRVERVIALLAIGAALLVSFAR
jgi:hypothetical protein